MAQRHRSVAGNIQVYNGSSKDKLEVMGAYDDGRSDSLDRRLSSCARRSSRCARPRGRRAHGIRARRDVGNRSTFARAAARPRGKRLARATRQPEERKQLEAQLAAQKDQSARASGAQGDLKNMKDVLESTPQQDDVAVIAPLGLRRLRPDFEKNPLDGLSTSRTTIAPRRRRRPAVHPLRRHDLGVQEVVRIA